MESGSNLGAVSGDWVSLAPGAELTMVSTSDANNLPTLNLGEVGRAYGNRPSRITVELPAEIDKLELFRHLIATGRTLGNCEEWASVAHALPKSHRITFECDPQSNSTVGEDGVRSLLMQGHDSGSTPAPKWILGVVTAACVLLVATVVVVVCIAARPKKKEEYPSLVNYASTR
jgi:hypothetical protein